MHLVYKSTKTWPLARYPYGVQQRSVPISQSTQKLFENWNEASENEIIEKISNPLNNKHLIKLIKNPSKKMQQAAICRSAENLFLIEDPHFETVHLAVEKLPMILDALESIPSWIQWVALKKSWSAIQFIEEPTLFQLAYCFARNPYFLRIHSKKVNFKQLQKLSQEILKIKDTYGAKIFNVPQDGVVCLEQQQKLLDININLVDLIPFPHDDIQNYILFEHPHLIDRLNNVSSPTVQTYKTLIA